MSEDEDIEFGAQVRAAREARGWSQNKLAAEVGTSQSTIERVENGRSLRSRFLLEITEALGLGLPRRHATWDQPSSKPAAVRQPLADGSTTTSDIQAFDQRTLAGIEKSLAEALEKPVDVVRRELPAYVEALQVASDPEFLASSSEEQEKYLRMSLRRKVRPHA